MRDQHVREMLKLSHDEAMAASKRWMHWHKVAECLDLLKRGWRIYGGHSMLSRPGRATSRLKVGRAVIASVRHALAREGNGDGNCL